MNVLITLPKRLIDKIIIGEKTLELRSRIPMRYDDNSRIYVVQKGTRRIRLSFRCPYFNKVQANHESALVYHRFLGISLEEYMSYVSRYRELCFWPIKDLMNECATIDDFNIKRNPQSFIYF